MEAIGLLSGGNADSSPIQPSTRRLARTHFAARRAVASRIARRALEAMPKTTEDLLQWARQLADQGQADAQFIFGICLFQGWDVPRNVPEAIGWLYKAANSEHEIAQCMLGILYASGRGVERDWDLAEKWFTRSATNGYGKAAYFLGYINTGTVEEEKWYCKAANLGYKDAYWELDRLI